MKHLFLLFFLATPILAQPIEFIKESLKHISDEERQILAVDTGKFCEFAASELLILQYDPAQFYILRNLNYGVNNRRSTGELDITVFSYKNNQAVQLYEVKCKKNEIEAYQEAVNQLERFRTDLKKCVHNPVKNPLYIGNSDITLDCQLFKKVKLSVLMPKGLKKANDPVERFSLTLAEIYELQKYLKETSLKDKSPKG